MLRGDAPRLFEELQRRYGDHVRIGRFHLLFHPDQVEDVLETNAGAFERVDSERRVSARIAGRSLFSTEGDQHDRQRRRMEPVMYDSAPDALAGRVAQLGAWMRDTLEEGRHLDLFEWTENTTTREMVALLFGFEPRSEENRRLSALIREAIERMDRLPLAPSSLPDRIGALSAGFRRARAELDSSLTIALRAARGDRRAEHTLARMLADAGLPDEELRDECLALFRGHQAVSTALTWTFFHLATHPRIEARLHDEIDAMTNGEAPGPEHLQRLDYTCRVVQESLRLLPPAWVLARTCVRDHVVDGRTVPAGSRVLLSSWVTHRDDRFWDDPLTFEPDRFLSEASRARPPYAYFPQGGGDKMCMGRRIVVPVEAPLVVAAVAWRWRFRLEPGFRVELAPRATLKPKRGVRVIVERRSPTR
jgi:cytochrome P450